MISPELDCVVIETTTACTRKCRWCTHHYYAIEPNFMPEALFLKIISELSEIDFHGRLSLYGTGEPLLDERLSKWIAISKKSCPKSFAFIITNGDLLSKKRIIELIDAGLDAIKVNTYDENTFKKVHEIIQGLPSLLSKKILHLDHSKKTDWTSRGGTVPIAAKSDMKQVDKKACLRPFKQIYITYDGMVAQCCSDPLAKYHVGDLKSQSLLEVWNGEALNKVRKSLRGEGELNCLCKICDVDMTYESCDDVKKIFRNREASPLKNISISHCIVENFFRKIGLKR
jgi:MoaA/NifB/PqqE/SkfB family radical SAM enzyme